MKGEPTPVILSLVRLGTGSNFLIYWSVVAIYVSATKIIDGESKSVCEEDHTNVSVCATVDTYCSAYRS